MPACRFLNNVNSKGDTYYNMNRCIYFVYINPVFSCRVTYLDDSGIADKLATLNMQ